MQFYERINDPNHPSYIVPVSHLASSKSSEHFNKINEGPYNLKTFNSPSKNFYHSNIYTKQGLLKRNDIGWGGVKLTEFVTEQLAQNYLEHQKIIEKFRREAEENRRIQKFSHVFQSRITPNNNTIQKPKTFLPPISSSTHQAHPSKKNSHISHSVSKSIDMSQESQREIETSNHQNKIVSPIDINECKKYIKLKNKYEALRYKYAKQKQKRRRQCQEDKLIQGHKQKQRNSLTKVSDELGKISEMLSSNNFILGEQLNKLEKSRNLEKYQKRNKKQEQLQNQTNCKQKIANDKTNQKKTMNSSLIECESDTEQNKESPIITKSLIKLPENPFQFSETDKKSPYVVYTNKTPEKINKNYYKNTNGEN